MKSSVVRSAFWMVFGAVAWIVGSQTFGLNISMSHAHHSASPGVTVIEPPGASLPRVERYGADTVVVPAELARKIGLRIEEATVASHSIKLPSFHGVLALDSDCLSHVHARFGGEVVEIGQLKSASGGLVRPNRVGDRVEQGDLLAVVWSTDLGSKKSELVDALAKLKSEEDLRDRLKKLASEGASPTRNYRDAEKAVQSRLVEVANAERTLRTWRMTDEDILNIRREAERLIDAQHATAEVKDWARVEVRAPLSGIVLEKNVAVGAIVDTTTELYKIGDTSHLTAWVHVYEEDLPLLDTLPRPVPWTVSVPSRPGVEFAGSLDRVGSVIDQAQHTALVSGRVENPTGDLKVGQFVTVTIELPPCMNEIELPVAAVVEDGRQSVVFVENDSSSCRFCRRSVKVVRRSRETIYVKAEDDGVRPGMRIVTAGALMVKNAMDQLAVPPAEATTAAIRPARTRPGGSPASL